MSFFDLFLIEGSSIFFNETILLNEFHTETELWQGDHKNKGKYYAAFFTGL